MKPSNFNFLQPLQAELAELATSAEKYVYSDPQSAIVKLLRGAVRWFHLS